MRLNCTTVGADCTIRTLHASVLLHAHTSALASSAQDKRVHSSICLPHMGPQIPSVWHHTSCPLRGAPGLWATTRVVPECPNPQPPPKIRPWVDFLASAGGVLFGGGLIFVGVMGGGGGSTLPILVGGLTPPPPNFRERRFSGQNFP